MPRTKHDVPGADDATPLRPPPNLGETPPGAEALMRATPPGLLVVAYALAHVLMRRGWLATRVPSLPAAGLPLIAGGLALMAAAGYAILRRRTAILPAGHPSTLVEDGPFAFSRNPIYLADVAVVTGIALTSGRMPHWLIAAGITLVLDRVYIPIEEARLDEAFGTAFEAYKARVRRWL